MLQVQFLLSYGSNRHADGAHVPDLSPQSLYFGRRCPVRLGDVALSSEVSRVAQFVCLKTPERQPFVYRAASRISEKAADPRGASAAPGTESVPSRVVERTGISATGGSLQLRASDET
jgi:hypothetical protein